MQQTSESLSLRQALNLLRRRMPLVVLCVLVVGGAAFVFSEHQSKTYEATASVVFETNPLSAQIANLPTGSSNPLLQQASNLQLLHLGDMAAKTAVLLRHGLTEQAVQKSLSILGLGESSAIAVTATAASPHLAAAIANTYVHQFVAEQKSNHHSYFTNALALVQRQLAALPPPQRYGPVALALQNRAQDLRFLSDLQYGAVEVAEQAVPPRSPSSPHTSRNTIMGLLLGLVIGLGIALLLGRTDDSRLISELKDLEALYDRPVLGTVPKRPSLASEGSSSLSTAETELFDLILARLRSFNTEREARVVLMASPAQGEGATTVAQYLAEAAARLGSRVLLIEANLRHSVLAGRLSISDGRRAGIVELLRGTVSLSEAAVTVRRDHEQGSLDVLTAPTASPPNPGALIQSHAMATMIDQARSTYDLVVIDAPPVLAVSDAVPLLKQVDGVVVVSWIGRTRRDAAEELRNVLTASGTVVLGVVANGSGVAAKTTAYGSDHARVEPERPRLGLANGADGTAGELVSSSETV